MNKTFISFLLFACLLIISNTEALAQGNLRIIVEELPLELSKVRTEKISHVVIHFMSNAAKKPHDPYNKKDLISIFEEYGVSAHYMIGREGEIFQLVSEDRVAYHAGKGYLQGFPAYKDRLNEYSLGIELLAIGTREEMLPMINGKTYDSIDPTLIGYTNAQYKSLQLLLENILIQNSSINRDRIHIIGHDEYAPERKTDPGSLFNWSRIGY
ncbi:N-acetylmuramoyl-L-alanine amidase [Ferdinandcohnia quinoae]|uniref:N-acetylmuramoyl-L-alanine amidase n=1 Tax=Fredinandcohnia quinoae TaxID=2918902 RepID=A0AAW5E6N0_9BACI|nr:N-acetylmuramoyl-L-alanine amidase [Fredinandcohnia sp. SECRCQ15]MCH1627149.1 N-acetylmuramoyl-L-alanine amidase [Fredinandcohnia sp. SECRCQ15]